MITAKFKQGNIILGVFLHSAEDEDELSTHERAGLVCGKVCDIEQQ